MHGSHPLTNPCAPPVQAKLAFAEQWLEVHTRLAAELRKPLLLSEFGKKRRGEALTPAIEECGAEAAAEGSRYQASGTRSAYYQQASSAIQ